MIEKFHGLLWFVVLLLLPPRHEVHAFSFHGATHSQGSDSVWGRHSYSRLQQKAQWPKASKTVRFLGVTGDLLDQVEAQKNDTFIGKELNEERNEGSNATERLSTLCQTGQMDEAVAALRALCKGQDSIPDHSTFMEVFLALGEDIYVIERHSMDKRERMNAVAAVLSQMDAVLDTMKAVGKENNSAYNFVILRWSKSYLRESGQRCLTLLAELWARHNTTGELDYVPLHTSYVSTLTALVRSGVSASRSSKGTDALATLKSTALRAEALLEEMERLRREYPSLRPDTVCVNIVLKAWCNVATPEASNRCEVILERLEDLYSSGRPELRPDTISYNTVIDSLSRSREPGFERTAERILLRMESLSSSESVYEADGLAEFDENPADHLKSRKLLHNKACKPDLVSFNTVLYCWANSNEAAAPRRADAILRHMERRSAANLTSVRPNVYTYNTVLSAWSKCTARADLEHAAERAQQILSRMEKAHKETEDDRVRPNTMSYNVLIHILSQSKDPTAFEKAIEVFEHMKSLQSKGRSDCKPDTYTYTTLFRAFARAPNQKATEKVLHLLEELEEAYRQTKNPALKPNIRTYTMVIHAIARSGSKVDSRVAEEVMERLERYFEDNPTDSDLQPDVVCYDALINAIGWSRRRGRALRCFEIYQRMRELYESKRNIDARPDIITANCVLNACAYEDDPYLTADEHSSIMKVAVQTLEDFEAYAPTFGSPNHITYANFLLAIVNHMPDTTAEEGQRRAQLAESTFWRAARGGHVSVLVVKHLHAAVPYVTLASLLGPALHSKETGPLAFTWTMLPSEWTRNAPSPKERRASQPSRKRPNRR